MSASATGTWLRIERVGPVSTVQDRGRFGMLRHGISASGPMDTASFAAARARLGQAGAAALEFSRAGIAFTVAGAPMAAAFDGGVFTLRHNGRLLGWPQQLALRDGDRVEVTPGDAGNYGYLAFDRELQVEPVLGSRATNLVAALGGLEGRALRAGDVLALGGAGVAAEALAGRTAATGPIRFVWGMHADLFPPAVRQGFIACEFTVSSRLDRMGVRLDDPAAVFCGAPALSLVSDAIVCGDVQILGDGTPIVLLRDHQPTGGYPRIATVIGADIDRLAQMRPGAALAFTPVTLHKAHGLYRSKA